MINNITVYGIPNCDSTRMAISWLKQNNIEFQFHDYKKAGISSERLNEWAKSEKWEHFLNKRGSTWKKLSPEVQLSITNQKAAFRLMQEHTSLIKRPILEKNKTILVGFDQTIYHDFLLS